MEVVVTTGATRRAKLQSKCHHQQTNTQIGQIKPVEIADKQGAALLTNPDTKRRR